VKIVSPVKDQLKTQMMPARLVAVSGAGGLPAAIAAAKSSREAFVVAGGERAHPNETGTIELRQKVVAIVTVFFTLSVYDAAGDAALDEAEPLRDEIKEALIGLEIAGAASPLAYEEYAVVDFDPGLGFLVNAVSFSTTYYERH
jgi:hypothetical protein